MHEGLETMSDESTTNIFQYLDMLFSKNLDNTNALGVFGKGRILQRVKKRQKNMTPKEKSELHITAWLLPERHKISDYYRSLPHEMNKQQKALAIRWLLERVHKNNNTSTIISDRNTSRFDRFHWSNPAFDKLLCSYYGRVSKRELCCCREILCTISELNTIYYEDVVANLLKEHKKSFLSRTKPKRRVLDFAMKSLIDKGIVRCKIQFREHGSEGLLKEYKILSLSEDIEYDVIAQMNRSIGKPYYEADQEPDNGDGDFAFRN